MGYIKRTPLSEFRAQNRGGVGSKGTETRDEDFVEHIYPATMHNTMMFFTQKGKCYWLKVYEIPEGTKNSKGRAIQNLLNIDSDDAVNAYLRVKNLNDQDFINSHYVLFCTKNGVIKKTLLEQYSRPRQNGVNAITIREDDRVIEVRMTNGDNEIIIANRNGRAIRFHESAVRVMGRTATGVRGMTLDEDGQDEVVGMICIKDPETETIMVVSEQGYGKRSDIEDYRKTNRGGKGVKTMNITDKTGKLVTIKSVTDENDLMIINKSGITIRLKVADVRIMGRATQGVRLINLEKRNDQIGSVCKVMKRVLFSMVLLLAAGFTFAQEKSVKEAKSIANDVKPDFAQAEKLINEALNNAETKDNAETWDVAGFIQKRINEKEMENAYLRKPYDTLKVYNSALNMCKYYFKCDELAQIPNEKGKIKNKFRRSNSAAILAARPNLINGGIQFFNLDKNKEALDFFATYVDIAINPMFEKENLLQTDTVLPQIAYYASLAAAKMEDYPSVLKYAPYAKEDKEVGKYAMEFISTALKAQGDTVK